MVQSETIRLNGDRLKSAYMPSLTSYERDLNAVGEKAVHDLESKPIPALNEQAKVSANAVVGLQSADEAYFSANLKASVAKKMFENAESKLKV